MLCKAKLKWLLWLCIAALCLSFVSLYVSLWNSDGERPRSELLLRGGHQGFIQESGLTSPGSPAGDQQSRFIQSLRIALKNGGYANNDNVTEFRLQWSEIVLSVVACGDRLNDTLVMIKSAVAFTESPLRIIIVADDDLRPKFQAEVDAWPQDIRSRVRTSIRPLEFPRDGSADEWKNLFKLCASQRLFFPNLLPDVDATLYVDTDVIFLRPLDDIWRFFGEMNASHLAAMAPENEDHATGWYNRFAQHPYYKPLGVNSGVMLMNLTRMRLFQWEPKLVSIYRKYKQKITWGDQDLLNILFHQYSDKLFIYPCEWNYRTDHCMYASICRSAETNGVAVVHGSRNVFHSSKQPTFQVLFETFLQYNLGQSLRSCLVEPLRENLQQTAHTNCGKIYKIFLKHLERYT